MIGEEDGKDLLCWKTTKTMPNLDLESGMASSLDCRLEFAYIKYISEDRLQKSTFSGNRQKTRPHLDIGPSFALDCRLSIAYIKTSVMTDSKDPICRM